MLQYFTPYQQTYRNASIYRPAHLFTFGTSRKGPNSQHGAYFFFGETTECSKQNFDIKKEQ